MNVDFEGIVNKKLQKYMRELAEFSLLRLLPKQSIRGLNITIEVRRNVEHDNDGYCEIEDFSNLRTPRDFHVVIKRNKSIRYMLMTLAHECVHIKQYVLGELDDSHSRWRGTKVNDEEVEYWELPWEIEAYGRERGLYTMFVESHGYKFPLGSQRDD